MAGGSSPKSANDTNRPVEIEPPGYYPGFGLVVLVNGPIRSRGRRAATFTPAPPGRFATHSPRLGSFAGPAYVAPRSRF